MMVVTHNIDDAAALATHLDRESGGLTAWSSIRRIPGGSTLSSALSLTFP